MKEKGIFNFKEMYRSKFYCLILRFCVLRKNTYSHDLKGELAARKKTRTTYNHDELRERLIRELRLLLYAKTPLEHWKCLRDNFQPDCCYFKLSSFYSNSEIVTKKLMLKVYLKKISGDSSPRSTVSSLKPGSATRLFVFHFC